MWRHGTEGDKKFVREVLLAYSNGADVQAAHWRAAERDWRKAIAVADAYAEPDPEFAAMNLLVALIKADQAYK
jgi:hypothetical protein